MQGAPTRTDGRGRTPTVCAYLLAVCVAAGGPLAAAAPAQAKPNPPGSNGDVKVHRTTTPVGDQADDPKVCTFYLDAFGFDTLQPVSLRIDRQPPKSPQPVLSGSLTLTNGTGRTDTLSIPKGMYKLFWHFQGETGADKHKVFEVACPAPGGGKPGGGGGKPGGGNGGGTPNGGVEAGLGGSQHASPLGEISAALLIAGSGFLVLRRVRRRLGGHAR